jgi:hypothetical protein
MESRRKWDASSGAIQTQEGSGRAARLGAGLMRAGLSLEGLRVATAFVRSGSPSQTTPSYWA